MRNDYIKFCDKHNISDGVLREMLIHEKIKEAIKDIKTAITKRCNEINALEELREILIEKQ